MICSACMAFGIVFAGNPPWQYELKPISVPEEMARLGAAATPATPATPAAPATRSAQSSPSRPMAKIAACARDGGAGGASVRGFPNRPISMVVAFSAGSVADTAARIVAKELTGSLGQSVVVENRAGDGGNIGNEYVAKSVPDGHTILLTSGSSLTVVPHFLASPRRSPRDDLAPLSTAAMYPLVLVVHASLPANTLAEFVQLVQGKPRAIAYGSSGMRALDRLAGERLRDAANIDIVHVAYKGSGSALAEVLGGQISSVFAMPAAVDVHIRVGKLRALATTGPQRSPYLPDVPTIAESGYPGYEATEWYAYLAPARTPKDILNMLNRELVKALCAPDVRDQLLRSGLEPMPGSRDETVRHIEREYETWGRLVKQANARPN